jgi:hypothetical protein
MEYIAHIKPCNINEIDSAAIKFTTKRGRGMGSFIAVFNPPLETVLMTKLGQYAQRCKLWPSMDPSRRCSESQGDSKQGCRAELKEETGLSSPSNMYATAWLIRPYFKNLHSLKSTGNRSFCS